MGNILIALFISLIGYSKANIEDNLLKNSEFESPLRSEWSLKISPGVKVLRDKKETFSGAYSLKIENLNPMNKAYYGCNQRIIAPSYGKWLKLKATIKTMKLKGKAGVDIHFLNAWGARLPIYEAKILLQSSGRSRDWRIYSIDFSIPEGTKNIIVAIFLKGEGEVWFDDLSLSFNKPSGDINKNPSRGAYVLQKKDPLMWFEYAEQKVYYETPQPTSEMKKKIEISGARNEWEPFQIVIRPRKNLKKCSIEFTDLIHKNGVDVIQKEQFTYYIVGYVNIKKPSTPDGVSGLNPDYLLKQKYFDLLANANNPIWINLEIPKNAIQGVYQGKVQFNVGEKNITKIPLEVSVWDFSIPPKNHFYVQSNFWLSLVKKFDRRNKAEILKDYYGNLKAHRINTFGLINLETEIIGDSLIYYSDKFNRDVRELFENYGVEAITLGPFLGDASGWKYRKKWMGVDPESPRFEYFLRQYCKKLESYLSANGWLNRCWISYWDEPPLDDPNFEKIVNIGKIIKESAPNVKIYMTKWPTLELFGIVDIWCLPFTKQYFHPQEIIERKDLGENIFVYHNDPHIDTPLIDKRLYAWRYRLAGIDGVYAWWNLAYWQNNPYENPHMIEEKEDRKNYLKPGNGILLYPNPDNAGPPVNSTRWEIFRQGLEDYEYFWLLGQKIDSALAHLEVNESFSDFAEYRVNQIINTLVTDSFTTEKRDVGFLYSIRRRIAEEIQTTIRSPIVLIKTDPQEESAYASRKIRISGLTEKGTTIFVNGRAIHVKNDGSFFTETNILDDGYILIKASLNNKEKIIKRFLK